MYNGRHRLRWRSVSGLAESESVVPVDQRYVKMVVPIIGTPGDDPASRSLRATGFLVAVTAGSEEHTLQFAYVVTAAHVVRSGHDFAVRVRTADGAGAEQPIEEWFFHPSEDVAVAPFRYQSSYDVSIFPKELFYDRGDIYASPLLGDFVYFIGLLSGVDELERRGALMVRSGTVGALYQDHVPVQIGPQSVVQVTAHLIDCRAYKGFSGSPCFAQFTRWGREKTPRLGLALPDEFTLLLGVVAGHFDQETDVRAAAYDDAGKVSVNTGVGIVTPVEHIIETLDLDELVSMRDAEVKALREPHGG